MRMIAEFEKMGRMSWFSHLDLQNTMQRALRRARLPVAYSQGFNPHPKLVFSSPLSVGYAGEREVVDVKFVREVSDDLIVSTLRPLLPEGLEILEAFTAEAKLDDIKWAENDILIHCGGASDSDAEAITRLFAEPVIMMKKSKSGEREVDICEMIKSLTAEKTNAGITVTAITAAGNNVFLNPSYIAAAIKQKLGIPGDDGYAEFVRRRLLLEDGVTEVR